MEVTNRVFTTKAIPWFDYIYLEPPNYTADLQLLGWKFYMFAA